MRPVAASIDGPADGGDATPLVAVSCVTAQLVPSRLPLDDDSSIAAVAVRHVSGESCVGHLFPTVPTYQDSRPLRSWWPSSRSVPGTSRQLPVTSPQQWHSVASVVEAVDLDLVAADHEVRVDMGAIDAHAA